jgi:hypothetical protein
MTLVFLLRYPEPRKILTNPRWCPYAKGSPREGKAHRPSNSVENRGPPPHASGAQLLAPLGRSPPSPLSSFRTKRRGPRSLRYTVATMSQTRLSRSRKTLAPLCTTTRLTQEPRGCVVFLNSEREMCPWAISINVLVIRCPTHIVLVHMC